MPTCRAATWRDTTTQPSRCSAAITPRSALPARVPSIHSLPTGCGQLVIVEAELESHRTRGWMRFSHSKDERQFYNEYSISISGNIQLTLVLMLLTFSRIFAGSTVLKANIPK